MLYLKDNKAYRVDEGGKVHGISVTAKDKLITRRELESVTVSDAVSVPKLPEGAVPVTVDVLVAKFNVSEEHPFEWPKAKKTK